uniref:Uncharacterized protein n=1 Tax=Caenorhabditis tropicalis TaxID=1561998 RepID=A0A1I7TBR5_9PELO
MDPLYFVLLFCWHFWTCFEPFIGLWFFFYIFHYVHLTLEEYEEAEGFVIPVWDVDFNPFFPFEFYNF